MRIERIAIWGPPVSGKTTLAINLGELLSIDNIIKTDDYLYASNWIEVQKDEFVNKVSQFLAKKKWIVDGNLGEYISRRELLELANLVIIFNPSTPKILYQICKRSMVRWINRKHIKHLPPSKKDPPVSLIRNISELCRAALNFKYRLFDNLMNIIDSMKLQHKVKIISKFAETNILLKSIRLGRVQGYQ